MENVAKIVYGRDNNYYVVFKGSVYGSFHSMADAEHAFSSGNIWKVAKVQEIDSYWFIKTIYVREFD